MKTAGVRSGRKPARHPELLACPGCGLDLSQQRVCEVGELWADPIGDTYWKGKPVRLSATLRLLLHSLLGRNFISGLVLAERLDATVDSVSVNLTHLRHAFRRVDPAFDQVETSHGEGWRWRTNAGTSKVIARKGQQFTLFANGEVLWRNRFRLFLEHGHQVAALKLLIEADGPVGWRAICEAIGRQDLIEKGKGGPQQVHSVIAALRRRFAEADPKDPILAVKNSGGRTVKPNGGYRLL